MTETQNEFKGWAKVEVMGHQSHIGYVVTEAYGQAVMFRIDQPAIPEEERVLTEREYTSAGYLPAGTVVKQPAIDGVTVLVGSGSIYRIIPCTESVAIKAVRETQRKPLVLVRLPDCLALPPAIDEPEQEVPEQEMENLEDDDQD